MIRILCIVIAVVSVLCGYLWVCVDQLSLSNERLSDDIEQYELTIQSSEATILELEKSAITYDQIILKQHNENSTLHAQLKNKQRELTQLSETNETVKDWAVEPVPAAISSLLLTTPHIDAN